MVRRKLSDLPQSLRAYQFLGLDIDYREGAENVETECPWCGASNKFSVNVSNGLWQCFVCKEGPDDDHQGGNLIHFLRMVHTRSVEATIDYSEIQEDRRFVRADTLIYWEVARNYLNDRWIVPAYDANGKLCQLYQNTRTEKGNRLMPTPGLGHQLFGTYRKECSTIYLTEGPWDGMALWECLSAAKLGYARLKETSNSALSLVNGACVLAVPGCGSIGEPFEKILPLFSGKVVHLMFDSDHPRTNPKTKKASPPAGNSAMKKAALMLTGYKEPPAEVYYLNWGKDGYDPDLPNGTDVRDIISEGGETVRGRLPKVEELLDKLESAPEDWRLEPGSHDPKFMSPAECSSYNELISVWRDALFWTQGMDDALGVMLGSIISTNSAGDQLWIKIIGPPSCISGDSLVHCITKNSNGEVVSKKWIPLSRLHRKINGLAKTTPGPEWRQGGEYYVQSVDEDGRVFRNKVQESISNGVKKVWCLTTLSGKVAEATADHEIFTEYGYRPLSEICIGDKVYINPGKPQKKGRNKYIRRNEVMVKYHSRGRKKTVKQGGKAYVYYRLRVYQAVYEANANKMPYREYLDALNTASREFIDNLWTIPEGWEIHHKDGDPTNNGLTNLELVESSSKHRRLYHVEKSRSAIAMYAELDEVVAIRCLGKKPVYDLVMSDPYRNFATGGIFVHNCGKSTLCEAVSVARNHVLAVSTVRGFFSGYQSDKEGSEDNSLVVKANGKCLVTKDADPMLQAPNLSQILSEGRDIYDRTSRTQYRNKRSAEYTNINMTWILCGTSALKSLDDSELGARFLDCVIMGGIDEEIEDEIVWFKAQRARYEIGIHSNGDTSSSQDQRLIKAMRMTGGYIEYLCNESTKRLRGVSVPNSVLRKCAHLGKFVSYMRARPSRRQWEITERELSARLVSQLVRLTVCLTAVLGKKEADVEVMRRVTKVAMDTSRGTSYEIAMRLFAQGEDGLTSYALENYTGVTKSMVSNSLRFLRKLGVVEVYTKKTKSGIRKPSWRITDQFAILYEEVHRVR